MLQILKAKLSLPPYLTNEARGLIKRVRQVEWIDEFEECYKHITLLFSRIFQRKISAYRLALVGMAGGRRPQLG